LKSLDKLNASSRRRKCQLGDIMFGVTISLEEIFKERKKKNAMSSIQPRIFENVLDSVPVRTEV